jgi:alpha/beta superfamily hydrolase
MAELALLIASELAVTFAAEPSDDETEASPPLLEGRMWVSTAGNEHASTLGVVVCHPHPQFGGNMDSHVVMAACYALRSVNISYLRFNFRGTGASTGMHTKGRKEPLDIYGAVTELRGSGDFTNIGVVGYSFGALVSLRTALSHPEIQLAVAIAPPSLQQLYPLLAKSGKDFLLLSGDQDAYCPALSLQDAARLNPRHIDVEIFDGVDHFYGKLHFPKTHSENTSCSFSPLTAPTRLQGQTLRSTR